MIILTVSTRPDCVLFSSNHIFKICQHISSNTGQITGTQTYKLTCRDSYGTDNVTTGTITLVPHHAEPHISGYLYNVFAPTTRSPVWTGDGAIDYGAVVALNWDTNYGTICQRWRGDIDTGATYNSAVGGPETDHSVGNVSNPREYSIQCQDINDSGVVRLSGPHRMYPVAWWQ